MQEKKDISFEKAAFNDILQNLSNEQKAQVIEVFEQPIVRDILNAGGVLSGGYLARILDASFNQKRELNLLPNNGELHPLEKIGIARRLIVFSSEEETTGEQISWHEFCNWAKTKFPKTMKQIERGHWGTIGKLARVSENYPEPYRSVYYHCFCVQNYASTLVPQTFKDKDPEATKAKRVAERLLQEQKEAQEDFVGLLRATFFFLQTNTSLKSDLTEYYIKAVEELKRTPVDSDCFTGWALNLEPSVCSSEIAVQRDANNIAWPLLSGKSIEQSPEEYQFGYQVKLEPYEVEGPNCVLSSLYELEKLSGVDPNLASVGNLTLLGNYLPPDDHLVWENPFLAAAICEPHSNALGQQKDGKETSNKIPPPELTNIVATTAWSLMLHEFEKRREVEKGSRKDLDFYFENQEDAERVSSVVQEHLSRKRTPLHSEDSFATLRTRPSKALTINELQGIILAKDPGAEFERGMKNEIINLLKRANLWWKYLSDEEARKSLESLFSPLNNWKNSSSLENHHYKRSLFSSSVFVFDKEIDTPYEIQLIFKEEYLRAEEEVEQFDVEKTRCFLKLEDGEAIVFWSEGCEEDLRKNKITVSKLKVGAPNEMNAGRLKKYARSGKIEFSAQNEFVKTWRRKTALSWIDEQIAAASNLICHLENQPEVIEFVKRVKQNPKEHSTMQLLFALALAGRQEITSRLSKIILEACKENHANKEQKKTIRLKLNADWAMQTFLSFTTSFHAYNSKFSKNEKLQTSILNELNTAASPWQESYFLSEGNNAYGVWNENKKIRVNIIKDQTGEIENINMHMENQINTFYGKNIQQLFSTLAILMLEHPEDKTMIDFGAAALTCWHFASSNLFTQNTKITSEWLKLVPDPAKRTRNRWAAKPDKYNFLNLNQTELQDAAETHKSICNTTLDTQEKIQASQILGCSLINVEDHKNSGLNKDSIMEFINIVDSNLSLAEKLLHPYICEENPLMNFIRKYCIWCFENPVNGQPFNEQQKKEFESLLDSFSETIGWNEVEQHYKNALQDAEFQTRISKIHKIIQHMLDNMKGEKTRTYGEVLS